jgi:lysophospholipase L1-like esterase
MRAVGKGVIALAACLAALGSVTGSDIPAHASAAEPTRHRLTVVAMGDSVAAGMGLEWTDWFHPDNCWQAGSRSYGGSVFAALRSRLPAADRSSARFVLLGCKGETAEGLASASPSPDGSQLDRAVALDPSVVTITAGANDLGFTHPERLFAPDGTVRDDLVRQRLAALRRSLAVVLTRLVATTSAEIVITTYHDPTASEPTGVPNCRGACFRIAAHSVVDSLDLTIAEVVGGLGSPRIHLADVSTRFEGHGAPNGWGPDALRAEGVPSWVPVPDSVRSLVAETGGIQAFCSSVHHLGSDPNWVNGIDCIHPNAEGAKVYAQTVLAALDGFSTA